MARTTRITFDTVKRLALQLPGTETGTSYGSPAVKTDGRVMVCMATNKQAEPGSLYVSLGFPERDELVEADPRVFYLRDHYVPWPCVLARLNNIHMDALRDLLAMSHAYVRSRKKAARRKQLGS